MNLMSDECDAVDVGGKGEEGLELGSLRLGGCWLLQSRVPESPEHPEHRPLLFPFPTTQWFRGSESDRT